MALCLFVLGERSAWAQRVLLADPVAPEPTLSEAFNRLRAELSLNGLDVTVIRPGTSLSPAQVETEARQVGAFAVIELGIETAGAKANVWIVDPGTGELSERQLMVTDPARAPAILAVRTADLLLSSLHELPAAKAVQRDLQEPSERPESRLVQPYTGPGLPRVRWQLRAGGAALVETQGLGSGFGGLIGLSVRPFDSSRFERIGFGAEIFGPLVGARYEADNGSASIRQELALARGSWDFVKGRWLVLTAIVGAGAYHWRARGEVSEPLRPRSSSLFSLAGDAGIELDVQLTRGVSIGVSGRLLFLSPEPVIAIDTNRHPVAEPLLLTTFGLGVKF